MTEVAVTTTRGRVAAEVRAEMARQRVSQVRVGLALNLSQSAVNRRMTGDLPFDVDELAVIAEMLAVPVEQFFVTTHRTQPDGNGPASPATGDTGMYFHGNTFKHVRTVTQHRRTRSSRSNRGVAA